MDEHQRSKEAADVVREWEMRIGNVPASTRSGWVEYLVDPDIVISLAKRAVKELADEWHANKKNPRPNFHDLEKRYKRLANIAIYEDDNAPTEFCEVCSNRGFLGIVTGWDQDKHRLVPILKTEVKACGGQLYQQLTPCSCPIGQRLNDKFFQYLPDQVTRMINHCGFNTPSEHFKHWVKCMALTRPSMGKYLQEPDEELTASLMRYATQEPEQSF